MNFVKGGSNDCCVYGWIIAILLLVMVIVAIIIIMCTTCRCKKSCGCAHECFEGLKSSGMDGKYSTHLLESRLGRLLCEVSACIFNMRKFHKGHNGNKTEEDIKAEEVADRLTYKIEEIQQDEQQSEESKISEIVYELDNAIQELDPTVSADDEGKYTYEVDDKIYTYKTSHDSPQTMFDKTTNVYSTSSSDGSSTIMYNDKEPENIEESTIPDTIAPEQDTIEPDTPEQDTPEQDTMAQYTMSPDTPEQDTIEPEQTIQETEAPEMLHDDSMYNIDRTLVEPIPQEEDTQETEPVFVPEYEDEKSMMSHMYDDHQEEKIEIPSTPSLIGGKRNRVGSSIGMGIGFERFTDSALYSSSYSSVENGKYQLKYNNTERFTQRNPIANDHLVNVLKIIHDKYY